MMSVIEILTDCRLFAAVPAKSFQRLAAMARQGFVNYSKEWWHFSLPGAGGPAYDFPVTARRN